MKHRRLYVALGAVAVCATAGFSYLRLSASGVEMTLAAEKFVKTLSTEQRAKALLAYDTPLRTDWHYIPKPTRKGLQVKEMNDEQRKAAFDLLQSALSALGYGKAKKIMQLETVL